MTKNSFSSSVTRRSWLRDTALAIGMRALHGMTSDGVHGSSDTEPKLYLFFDGSKWGYVDQHGVVVVSPRFEIADQFNERLARVYDEDRKQYGYIRTDGSWAFHLPDDCVASHQFSEGLAWFRRESCFGLLNRDGEVIVEPKYSDAKDFSEGLATFGFREGCDCNREYDPDRDFFDKRLPREKWGVIDRSGNVVVAPTFPDLASFREGLSVTTRDHWSFIDRDGMVCLTLDHLVKSSARYIKHVRSFSGERSMVYLDGRAPEKLGVLIIDRRGQIVGTEFRDVSFRGDFSEGLVMAEKSGKCGYYDTEARLAIEHKFDDGGDFHGGICRAQLGSEWMFIDRSGAVVLQGKPEPWNDAEDFHGALARVHVGGTFHDEERQGFWSHGKWIYVNREGHFVTDCRRDEYEKRGRLEYSPFGREFRYFD